MLNTFIILKKINALNRREQPSQSVRTREHNILELPGLKKPAWDLGTKPYATQIWDLLFTHDMLEIYMMRSSNGQI